MLNNTETTTSLQKRAAEITSRLPSVYSNKMLKALAVAGLVGASSLATAGSTDFFGYFRAVSAWSEDGNIQEAFQLPGAKAKYRLGNESDNYAELGVKHTFDLPANYGNKNIEAVFMLADGEDRYANMNTWWDDTTFVQSYLKFDNFLGDGISAWAGRRFYKRADIHMNDYFWMNTGGGADGGFGIEGVDMGWSKFSFASFRFKEEQGGGATPPITGTNFDVRFEGINTNTDGNLTLWLYGAMQHETAGVDSESGFGIGAWHTQSGIMGGSNTMALLYKEGAASNGTVELGAGAAAYDDMASYEFNNNLVIEPSDAYSMQLAFIARVDEATAGDTTWMSLGARPVFYMTDHVSVAVELGIDHVDVDGGASGMLTKGTVALQLAKGRGYYNRPVLRGFFTFANWDDEFQGGVGGTTYADDTSGWVLGVQAEAWW